MILQMDGETRGFAQAGRAIFAILPDRRKTAAAHHRFARISAVIDTSSKPMADLLHAGGAQVTAIQSPPMRTTMILLTMLTLSR